MLVLTKVVTDIEWAEAAAVYEENGIPVAAIALVRGELTSVLLRPDGSRDREIVEGGEYKGGQSFPPQEIYKKHTDFSEFISAHSASERASLARRLFGK